MAAPTGGLNAFTDWFNQGMPIGNVQPPSWLSDILRVGAGVGAPEFTTTQVPIPSNLGQQSYGRYLPTSVGQTTAYVPPTTRADVMNAGMPGPMFGNMVEVKTPSGHLIRAMDDVNTPDMSNRMRELLGKEFQTWIDEAKGRNLGVLLEASDEAGGPANATIGGAAEWIRRQFPNFRKEINDLADTIQHYTDLKQSSGLFSYWPNSSNQNVITVAGSDPARTLAHETVHAMDLGQGGIPPISQGIPELGDIWDLYNKHGWPFNLSADNYPELAASLLSREYKGGNVIPEFLGETLDPKNLPPASAGLFGWNTPPPPDAIARMNAESLNLDNMTLDKFTQLLEAVKQRFPQPVKQVP